MEWLLVSVLLLLATLLHVKAVHIYIYSTNDNISDTHHFTLQDYINNTGRRHHPFPYNRNYNNTRLLLQPGEHFLQTDFIIQNAHNFTIQGNNSKIYCNKSFLGITFINVSCITLNNTEIINCGKGYVLQSNSKAEATNMSSAVYFDHCTDVIAHRVSVIAQSGTNGITVINSSQKKYGASTFQDIRITINCSRTSLLSSGILFYFHNHFKQLASLRHREFHLFNYKYQTIGVCKDSVALNIATNQTVFNVLVKLVDSKFTHSNNSGLLKYHGESCGALVKSILNFINCSIEHNQGNKHLKLLYIVVSNNGYVFSSKRENIDTCTKQKTIISFKNCSFINNSNMKSILYILLQNSLSANVLIDIRNSNFIGNNNTQIIKINSKVKVLWQVTHYIILMDTVISSNSFGRSLMSSANGFIKFLNSVIIRNNTYQDIVRLYFSVLRFHGYTEFSGNTAHYIIDSIQASYFILKEHTIINITKNYVYSVMIVDTVWSNELKPVCIFQFISNQSDLEKQINENISLIYQIDMTDNVYFAPKFLVQQSTLYYEDCTWLKDTAFSSVNSSLVLSKVLRKTVIYANWSVETRSLTICPCINASVYNCSQRYLGTVSPGQTLTTKLKLMIVQPFEATFITSFSRTEKIAHACHLLNAFEIEQEHKSNQCIAHNYTIWSQLSQCALYLTPDKGITETLYVKLIACPAGFVLSRQRGICYCDPLLDPYVTSCNLNDETVLRSANSWLFAYMVNESYEYKVSQNCPYDYCLPHQSHLNLSMPDTQCQFHRTGLACGECPQGLSTTFGSSQCKHCSDYYLFIIIPIALVGVVLVIMIFIFNLTVTSGTINTFIFYVNIISINYSLFFPECNSIGCLLLSLSNLDLGFEMCFYNGMDGYAKALLQLVFPLYLMVIAFLLIIGSRHSAKIQRITSQRALHVLATLFLLSYTKILLTVCQVLFFYSEIIHLPSNHITLVWSLDVSVPLFGVKFLIAFITCLVIFIILLYFNFLLLFTRQMLRFKCISTFKPLLDAYFGPYKDRCYYWTGLQLTLRAMFLGLSALHRNVNLTSGIIILGILLFLQGLLCPFKSRYKNMQEALLLLNLQILYALALYSDDDSDATIIIIHMLILLVLIYFFIVLSYQCLMSFPACSRIIIRLRNQITIPLEAFKDKIFTSSSTFDGVILKDVNNRVSGDYHEFQESLIALEN